MERQPTGTVTFLFTDVEGSTRRWEEHPEAMGNAGLRHDAILRTSVETHGGSLYKTIGDAIQAAFAHPVDALGAALQAQRALHAEEWGEVGEIRVRMALHTGLAQADHLAPFLGATRLRQGDYAGPLLNRVARLLAVAHGGQILLTEATAALVRETLSEKISLRDLGEHRLRDLLRPEHIFQVVAPDLPDQFPPLASLERLPNNLPLQATPFLGRERELAAIGRQLRSSSVRLLTLVGPGGSGKTRLALQAGADLLDDFPDGVFFVPLEAIVDPALVLPSIGQVLKVRQAGSRPLVESLREHLQTRRLLLILDNFEQILPAAASVAALLEGCPGLKALVTSRFALQLTWEHELPVPPLDLPEDRRVQPAAEAARFPAVALFVTRAQAIKPDFALTDGNAPAVVEICRRLDGLPLAIELAAARVRLLPPPAMLSRLRASDGPASLRLLTGGARDLSARQATLRATIAWSYDLLAPSERTIFRRLAVFVGGFDLEAAEAIVPAVSGLDLDLLDGLDSLAAKCLVQSGELDGEPRFSLLVTIRDFATDVLGAGDEANLTRRAHATHFLELAEEAAPSVSTRAATFARLGREHDNLRAAIRFFVAAGDTQLALRLAAALRRFWANHGYLTEGRALYKLVLDADATKDPTLPRARALQGAGDLAIYQNDLDAAQTFLNEAMGIARQLGHKQAIADTLHAIALVGVHRGDLAAARSMEEKCLALYTELGEVERRGNSLNTLGAIAYYQGDYTGAREAYEQSPSLKRQSGDSYSLGITLANLGEVAHKLGDEAGARNYLFQAVAIEQERGMRRCLPTALEALAAVYAALGRPLDAIRAGSRASALRDELGVPLPSADRPDFDRTLDLCRQALGPEAFARAWSEGQTTPVEQEIADAPDQPGASGDAEAPGS